MSLVAFKGQNHPQQVGRNGARDSVDDRGTTWEMFNPLHERFGFTIDVAAAPHNAKLPRYFTKDDDGLAQPWAGERVWCNPPYSDIRPWVEKAWDEKAAGVIVMLLPANRTEQGWWQDLVEPYRDLDSRLRTQHLRGRPRFIVNGDKVNPNERPPFGCVLLIWEDRASTEGRRELLCMICGCDHPTWHAPSWLWNKVVRTDGKDEWPFLCPSCFASKAVERGVNEHFVLSIEGDPPRCPHGEPWKVLTCGSCQLDRMYTNG